MGPKKQRSQPTRAALAAPPIDLDYVSRRVKRHLNDLERSNYTEPAAASAGVNAAQQEEAELAKGMTALARDAAGEEGKGKKRKTAAVRTLLMYRKNLATLIDESQLATQPASVPSYLTVVAPKSRFPPLQLCSVCGYKGRYTCQRCGLKYCETGCKTIHDESRCEKR